MIRVKVIVMVRVRVMVRVSVRVKVIVMVWVMVGVGVSVRNGDHYHPNDPALYRTCLRGRTEHTPSAAMSVFQRDSSQYLCKAGGGIRVRVRIIYHKSNTTDVILF